MEMEAEKVMSGRARGVCGNVRCLRLATGFQRESCLAAFGRIRIVTSVRENGRADSVRPCHGTLNNMKSRMHESPMSAARIC